MKDGIGRQIDYIRISLTDRCNMRCQYCMPQGCTQFLPDDEQLSWDELLRLSRIFTSLGVSIFKITGGEPLMRKGATDFIRDLKSSSGVSQVTLTTNGTYLNRYLNDLEKAGLDGMNISLDSLREEVFSQLTGTRGVAKIIQSIENAAETNISVKLNCVPMKGINEDDLLPLAAFAKDKVKAVRFIEMMPIGLGSYFEKVTMEEILPLLEERFGEAQLWENARLGNGPARYYSLPDFHGKIGFINAVSHEFCASCNRVRLTSDGWLRLCLAFDTGIDLKTPMRQGANDEALRGMIEAALFHKPLHHGFKEGQKTNDKKMFQVGG